MSVTPLLVLLGSGEFTSNLTPIDSYLISRTGKPHPRVAIIPTASGQEKAFARWLNDGTQYFSKLQAQPLPIAVKNEHDANQSIKFAAVNQADIIYLSGGDPGYLRFSFLDSLLWQTILSRISRGATLVGSSAGAMVFGQFMLMNPYQVTENHAQPNWQPGFNLLPGSIIPHYDYLITRETQDYNALLTHIPSHIKPTLLGIDENTALILTHQSARIIGPGKVHLIDTGVQFDSHTKIQPLPSLFTLSH